MTQPIQRPIIAALVLAAALAPLPCQAQPQPAAPAAAIRKPAQAAKPAAEPKQAAEPASTRQNDADAVAVMRQLEAKYAQITTIQGSFAQRREDPSFGDRIDSQARFSILKPDNFRVDYLPPRESTNLISGGYSYRYIPQNKQVERYKYRGGTNTADLDFLLLGFGAKTEDVLKVYTVQKLAEGVPAGMRGIKLTPVNRKESNFNHVTILLTEKELVPAQFGVSQLDGARTTANIDLKTLQLGGRIAPTVFQPNWPASTKIIDF